MCPPLVAPGPGTCPIMLLAASSPWSLCLPAWDLPQPLVLPSQPPPQHSWHPASCLLAQFGGSPQLRTPNERGVVGGGETAEIGVWIERLMGCGELYWG